MTRRFLSSSLLLVSLAFAGVAQAGPLPAAAKAVLDETVNMLVDGKADEWIEKHCDPNKCRDQIDKDRFKQYAIKSATQHGGACLHGEKKETQVERVRGEPASGVKFMVYVNCTGRQMPPPVGMRWEPESKRYVVNSLSL
ncbi:MAG: hypothetical protein ACI9MC_000689 [Kiritimatiellia bacterium]|jgi:hypothetical protein